MATPDAPDVIYMGRPEWSVTHRLPVAGVPSPSKLAGNRLSQRYPHSIIALRIASGILLAAVCFFFIRAGQTVRNLQDTARPWAGAALEAQQQEVVTPVENQPVIISPTPTGAASDTHTNTGTKVESVNGVTSVTVNGEQVTVPEGGTIHRSYADNDSRSSVTIRVNRDTAP